MKNTDKEFAFDFDISWDISEEHEHFSYIKELLQLILKYVYLTQNGKIVKVDGFRYIQDRLTPENTIELDI